MLNYIDFLQDFVYLSSIKAYKTEHLNVTKYYTTIQRRNPGEAKYHNYHLELNIDLNTTTDTELHKNILSHFTFDAYGNIMLVGNFEVGKEIVYLPL